MTHSANLHPWSQYAIHHIRELSELSLTRRAVFFLLLLFLGSTAAFAQSGAGSIQGTVTDASGAMLAGTRVHVVDTERGTTQDTVANASGFYTVPSLIAGNYRITFNAEGMSERVITLTLQVGQTASINAALKVGSSTQSVTVTADQVQLANYTDQTVSTTLERQRIEQLPLNQRNIVTLIGETTPGVEGQRVGGLEAQGQQYVLDGAVLVSNDLGGVVGRQPDPDSIQEVRAETSNSSAKFDLPATTILTTRSGTNQFHGSLFETTRNNGFGVARARLDPVNLHAPKYIRNEFGVSLGGPILIPKIYNGKDKAFFFVAYERQELRSSSQVQLYVPTLAMRQGDFSGLVNSAGVAYTIYDPATTQANGTRTPFNYGGPASCTATATATCTNRIDPARISPLAKSLYSITPLPTNSSNPYQAPNYVGGAPNTLTAPWLSGRLDYHLDQHNLFYLRGSEGYNLAYSLNQPAKGPIALSGGWNGSYLPNYNYSGALGYTHIFSPSFFAETVISNTWDTTSVGVATSYDPSTQSAAVLGLPGNFGTQIMPNIGSSGTGNGQNSMLEEYQPGDGLRHQHSTYMSFDENLTKIIGRHDLQFGGRFRKDQNATFPVVGQAGVTYSGVGTGELNTATVASGAYSAVPNTGLATADFFIGNAVSYNDQINSPLYHLVSKEFALYLQDDFKVNSRLTLNMGLRYEPHPALVETNHLLSSFDLVNHAVVLQTPIADLINGGYTTQSIVSGLQAVGVKFETPEQAGFPADMTDGAYKTVEPRVGAAYRVLGMNHSLVVRGGYGIYYYPEPTRNYYTSLSSSPLFSATFTRDFAAANQSPDLKPNYLLRSTQPAVTGATSSGLIDFSKLGFAAGVFAGGLDPHHPPDKTQNANITIEQNVGKHQVLRISGVSTHGSDLEQDWRPNEPRSTYVYFTQTGMPLPTGTATSGLAVNPYDQSVYGRIEIQRKTGLSNDYSAQVQLQRPFANGFAFQVFYVFSSAFRMGSNGTRDSIVQGVSYFAPGYAPANDDAANRRENYLRDTGIPRNRLRWDYLVDLPIGQGKRFLGKAPRWLDEIVGGFQWAGVGSVFGQQFALGSGNWGATGPLQVYKHAHPIQQCSTTAAGSTCYPGFQYFNGYVASTQNNNSTNGYTGLPTNYTPYTCPLNTALTAGGASTCGTSTPGASTSGNPNYGNNNVNVPLSNGTTAQNVAFNPGPGTNPFARTILQGPFITNMDMSIYKKFTITERVSLKVNLDAFNVFNIQGDPNPNGTSGIQLLTSSVNTPRQLQATVRISF